MSLRIASIEGVLAKALLVNRGAYKEIVGVALAGFPGINWSFHDVRIMILVSALSPHEARSSFVSLSGQLPFGKETNRRNIDENRGHNEQLISFWAHVQEN
eukprot:gb/GECG01005393.1/.p1 GENE.gb/GECG01005393.1/~~gb/GECG01005393.1/.p1  ORF type:complete len:101 (+),score=7.31 gb/GECG01005393.1/:1-303(+)